MVKLYITSQKVSPEFVYKEYVPHFDWLISKNHTECGIASAYPELFNSENVIPVSCVRDAKKTLASVLDIPVKHVLSQLLSRSAISPSEKLFVPFKTNPIESLVIPKSSNLLKYLEKLKNATKIVTGQEIFAYFAVVHKIPCLAFYDEGNPNPYKSAEFLKVLPSSIDNKTEIIDNFLENMSNK